MTEFLLARIAEDEAVAAAAVSRRDGVDKWEAVGSGTVVGPGYDKVKHVMLPSSEDGAARHIARHDPARVLAECEAKRRIIERGPSECGGYQSEHGLGTHYPAEGWSYCDGCSAAESADLDWQWIMRHLATVYADHEDYRAEWAL